jgi:hypothetical protein
MLKINKKLQLISQIAYDSGEGTLVAIYNDIEEMWHYYLGNFKPKNPSNHIYFHTIIGKCIDYIVENEHTFFTGDLAKNDIIRTHIYNLETEEKEFDFRFVWFKG